MVKRASKGLGAVALAAVCWTGVDAGSPAQAPPATPPARPAAQDPRRVRCANSATIKQYCVTCHNDRAKTGGLSLEGLDVANAARRRTSGRRWSARCAWA